MKKPFYTLLIFVLMLSSCNDDDGAKPATGSVLVFNEGNFNSKNATVGIYNSLENKYNPSAYNDANGKFIGDTQQSAVEFNGKIYSVLNGSNAIISFDSETLLEEEVISDDRIFNPRYMVTSGNTGYVSNSGPYENGSLADSYIVKINLQDNTVIGIIETGEDVEHVFVKDDILLLTRSKWDGSVKSLSIINISENKVVNEIAMPEGPAEIVGDAKGNVWVICESGSLVKLNADLNAISETVDLNGAVLGDIDLYKDDIYFLQNNIVKKVNIDSREITTVLSTADIIIPYSLAVNPNTGDIYIGDGVEYGSEGKVYRYALTGEIIDDFTSGILPTQFIFN